MLYVVRKFENGGILCSDRKPQVITEGMFKGLTKLDGKRYQVSSIQRMVNQYVNDPEAVEVAKEYTDALEIGQALPWASAGDEPVQVTIDDQRVTLTRKWATIDLIKMKNALEAFVNAAP